MRKFTSKMPQTSWSARIKHRPLHLPQKPLSLGTFFGSFWGKIDFWIFLAQRRAPKSTLLGTRESNKKHDDLEHDFLQEGEHQKSQFARRSSEGEHQKARFLGRRRAPKSRQRRAFHKGEHQKAQFLARRKAPKSTI